MTGPGLIPSKLEIEKRAGRFGPTLEEFAGTNDSRGLQIAREQIVDRE